MALLLRRLAAAPMRAESLQLHFKKPAALRSAIPLRPAVPVRSLIAIRSINSLRSFPRRMKATLAIDLAAAESASGSTTSAKSNAIAYWLLGTAGMVFVMVVLGGVTRLTRSGLSIVEWRPEGEKLPQTEEEWAVEFQKYKAFPEYQRVNSRMSLEEFKPIYFMEWFHRMWGRAIGIAFGVPLLYFAATKSIPAGYGGRLGLLLSIGATQGAVGWWMVKSGLEHERFNEYKIPRVSPYRLATHLGFAWTIYSLLCWNGWDLIKSKVAVTPAQAQAALKLRTPVALATAIIGTTVASGAFVAGNDAGHAYNDWPFFAGRVIPEQIWDESLGYLNFFENTATVQFDHRMLAYTSIAGVGLVHAAAKRAGGLKSAAMPPGFKMGAIGLGALVAAQATLGITTLMLYVPVSLGAAHQGGALALWTGALYTMHSVARAARFAQPAHAAAATATLAAGRAAPAAMSIGALALLLQDADEERRRRDE